MASPLSGPGNGFFWDSLNNGNVSSNNSYVQSGSLHTNTTIDGLGTVVTVVKGQLVTGTGIPTPNFITTGTSAAASISVITATTTTAVETVTIQNLPVLIGGENSATLAAGGAL